MRRSRPRTNQMAAKTRSVDGPRRRTCFIPVVAVLDQRRLSSPGFAHPRQNRFLGDGASLMADPAIDGLVSRRSFTAERSRKSACVSRQTGRSPPPQEKNKDTGGQKGPKILPAQTDRKHVGGGT